MKSKKNNVKAKPLPSKSFARKLSLLIFLLMVLLYVINVIIDYKYFSNLLEITEETRKVAWMTSACDLAFLVTMLVSVYFCIVKFLRPVTMETERIENELHIARDIQDAMLPVSDPSFDNHGEFGLAAQIRPAREVGGDIYDYMLRDNRIYFLIGDASGKGVPASMFMSATKYLYRALATDNDSASDIVSKINNALCDNNSTNMFETLVVGILDLVDGSLELCNAGHTAPISICSERKTYLELEANIPVGVVWNYNYRSQHFRMMEGDTLLFYTDGVTEAENSQLEQFGRERLLEVALDAREKAPKAFIEDISRAIDVFTRGMEQSDDITIMALRLENCIWKQEIVLSNRIGEMEKIREIVETASELYFPAKVAQKMMLAVEEAAVNIINYGWQGDCEASFSFQLKVFRNSAVAILTDKGKEFNPLEAPLPDTDLPLQDRQAGGMGIVLLRKLTDYASYRRRCDNTNILSLKFNY
ncbi:MAG: SpoIIE family protein phosphatase [Candidatus Cryptobacteroides sp.]